jgi:serine/threonine-protein kinase
MALTAGTRLGPYELQSLIGAGGMGEVYRARDRRLGRDVAIKVLSGQPDPDRLLRFEQEARAVAALSHPNVISIFDVGAHRRPYLVTELLEGHTLRTAIDQGPLLVSRAVDLALQLVAGLSAAHARGIVHRDLKPENLFLTTDGRLKILDFGLAKVAAGGSDLTTIGATGARMVLGTFGYMSPEQARGLDADARSDIFAFGAILYELLTGRRAFGGGSAADALAAVLHQPVTALSFGPEVPAALVRIIHRCLEKDPAGRFQSARELGAAIEALSDARSTVIVAPPAAEPTSIAVLPFANLSAEPDNQYFSDGLAEDLIGALARLPGMRVAAATTSFRFRARDADVREVGHEIGVDAILEGSVRRSGGRLRITTRLVDVDSGYQLWSDRYDRTMADVFDVQDEIVASIVQAIAPALLPAARAAAHHGTRNLDAYELYLKGRFFWNQRSPAVLQAALTSFQQALERDPDYALAYTGLADCYTILHVYGWMPPERCRPLAGEALARALALEPGLPEAHLSRALYIFHFERRWREARQSFVNALTARPRMASAAAHFSVFLATAYEFGDARERIGHALDVDPHSSAVHFLAACTACLTGDWEAAERHSARALELQPESLGARWPQTVALLAMGRMEDAIAAGEVVVARSRAPVFVGVMAMVYGRAGRLADASRILQELDERRSRGEFIAPAAYLSVHLGLGNRDGVRDALRACVDGAAPMSVVGPTRFLLDGYREDAEIGPLLARLHDEQTS